MLTGMELDSVLRLKLPLALVVVSLLNGCNNSADNLFENFKNSPIFTSEDHKISEPGADILDNREELKVEKLDNLSNTNNSQHTKVKDTLIAPVAAVDNFFGNIKNYSFFASGEKTSEPKLEKLPVITDTDNAESGGVQVDLASRLQAVDNFFKNLQKPQFFAPVEKIEVPEAEKLSTDLINYKAKYETTNAILNSPVLAVASKRAFASSKSLDILASQKNPNANLSINTGIFPEDGKLQPGAQGTISISKFMFDYGQTDRQLKLAALETKASILSAHITLNTELTKLLTNFILLDGANRSLEVIDTYLLKYEEREKTIKTAVSSGILSRADLLEIEAAKNNIDSQYERLKLSQRQSEAYLKTYLRERFSEVNEEVKSRLVLGYEFSHSTTNVSADLIAVRKIATETEIEIAQNFDKFRINGTASLSSPSPVNDSFTTFAGFSITRPILDGGQSPATIDKKKADLEVLTQEISALELERELAISSWETYAKYHRLDDKFLVERKEILLDKSIELERRFKAGQVDIVSLASAVLTSAQAEVDVIQHRTELMRKKLEVASVLTQPCVLLSICADIQKTFPTE